MIITENTDLFLGRLVKPFGIKGDVKLYPSDDFWDGVLQSRQLRLIIEAEDGVTESPLKLERFRKHGKFFVLKLTGVNDRNAAEALMGAELFISLEKIDIELPETILPFQITGCAVTTEAGERIGTVTGMMFNPAHPIYEITGENGVSLIPAVPEFVIDVDLDKGVVVVRPIPGLLSGT
jgi:16S rRNA processing protein RimM